MSENYGFWNEARQHLFGPDEKSCKLLGSIDWTYLSADLQSTAVTFQF